ncbi:MAG: hypothetical protein MJ224_04900 [archaeon]|nr:hypothetical protein [archaeon]
MEYSVVPENSFVYTTNFADKHINSYRYDVKSLDGDYIEKFDEKVRYQDGQEKFRTGYSICAGDRDSNYDVISRDMNIVEPVGRDFFSKTNIKKLQNDIKTKVYLETNGNIVLDEDQDDSDLLIVMRAVYYQEGRFLPQNVMPIDYQVKKLNIKVINYLYPDLMTNIKQEYYYIKEINEPIKPIDRPVNVSIKGSKTNSLFVY